MVLLKSRLGVCKLTLHSVAMTSGMDTPAESNEDFGGPTASMLGELNSQLNHWRSLLPPALRWPEDDPLAYPMDQQHHLIQPSVVGGLPSRLPPPPPPALFTSDLDKPMWYFPYIYDLQVALLRTRYYYAKYMVHRPYIYKALHFPEQMTAEDAEGVAVCLRVSFFSLPILHDSAYLVLPPPVSRQILPLTHPALSLATRPLLSTAWMTSAVL